MAQQKTSPKKEDNTYRRILTAATSIFSEKGFAGARMDEIARQANVNKATIYYHIGDKSALYSAVLHEVFSSVADQMEARIKNAVTPEEKLAQYVRTIAENIARNPSIPPIMLREIATQGANWPNSVAVDFARIFQMLTMVLNEGMTAGIFREANPFVIHFSTLGPLILMNRMKPKIQYYTQETGIFPESVRFPDNTTDSIVDNVVNAVLKK